MRRWSCLGRNYESGSQYNKKAVVDVLPGGFVFIYSAINTKKILWAKKHLLASCCMLVASSVVMIL